MLEIKSGKIFIKGVETNNPEFIGLSILDFAEDVYSNNIDVTDKYLKECTKNKPFNPLSDIDNSFNIEDIVYLKHDIEQLPRMIVEIRMKKYEFLYVCQSGTDISDHNDFELSKTKTVY